MSRTTPQAVDPALWPSNPSAVITPLRPFARLELKGLLATVHLGWPDAERAQPQDILIDVTIDFVRMPEACLSDDLSGTLCYDQMSRRIREFLSAKPFRLIEQLAFCVYGELRQMIAAESRLTVRITKRPPIPNLEGGASFTFGDERE
jgi:dihydroneopterin aldolase